VPDDLVAALTLADVDPARAILEVMAIEAYRERRIAAHQIRTLLASRRASNCTGFLKSTGSRPARLRILSTTWRASTRRHDRRC
jgi:hypothetical protein